MKRATNRWGNTSSACCGPHQQVAVLRPDCSIQYKAYHYTHKVKRYYATHPWYNNNANLLKLRIKIQEDSNSYVQVFSSTSQKSFLTALCLATSQLFSFKCILHVKQVVYDSERARWDVKCRARLDWAPTNETPVLLDAPAKCQLLTLAGAHRCSQLQLRKIILDSDNTGSGGHWPYVKHQDLTLSELRDPACPFRSTCPHPQQPP